MAKVPSMPSLLESALDALARDYHFPLKGDISRIHRLEFASTVDMTTGTP